MGLKQSRGGFDLHSNNIGALIIRIGFWDILYSNYNKETPKAVLVIVEATILASHSSSRILSVPTLVRCLKFLATGATIGALTVTYTISEGSLWLSS